MLILSGGGEVCVAGHKGVRSGMVSCCRHRNVFHIRLDGGQDIGWRLVLVRLHGVVRLIGGMRLRGGVCAAKGNTTHIVRLLRLIGGLVCGQERLLLGLPRA